MSLCGNPKCGASTGICESPTFGSGKLDEFSYWEKPCSVCTRKFEKLHPEYGSCWPFKKEGQPPQVIRKERQNDDTIRNDESLPDQGVPIR